MTTDITIQALRATIKALLENPHDLKWTVQGFGMMRCYLDSDKKYRLNIWDGALAYPGVSTIHDHPWHFKSWIINGAFRNVRYVETLRFRGSMLYSCMVIKTGEVGGPVGLHEEAWMHALPVESYTTGDVYQQQANEIHKSMYDDGTVTLNERTRVGDGEHARVFWPHGQEWGDAIPRKATQNEISNTAYRALEKWQ